MLFILRTGVVIQLNLFGKHWRKDEYHTNVDLLPPYCACPMYDLSRLVPYGEDIEKGQRCVKQVTHWKPASVLLLIY